MQDKNKITDREIEEQANTTQSNEASDKDDNLWKKVESWADLEEEIVSLVEDDEKDKAEKEVAIKSNFPNWTDILAIIGILFLALTVAQPIASMLGFGGALTIEPNSAISSAERRIIENEIGRTHFWIALISQVLIYTLLVIYRAARGGKWGVVRASVNGLNPTILLWGIIMLLATSVTINPLMDILPQNKEVFGRGIYMIAAVALVAPIFEEIIFRGMLLEAVRHRFGAWSACVVSAFIFGLIHIQIHSMVNATIMGLILGFLYLRTRSIFAPIIIHAVNNLLAYLLLIIGAEYISLSDVIGNETIYRIVYGASVFVLLLSIIVIISQISKRNKAEAEQNKQTSA